MRPLTFLSVITAASPLAMLFGTDKPAPVAVISTDDFQTASGLIYFTLLPQITCLCNSVKLIKS
ncbi:hypothetical protein [Mucilaginibacter sp. UYCu711]|uniref:hypothetical protein n=1 Tax=Mucilaginibacter sp. UYCu711 TaxID=3156339 RepID=UPI003D1A7E88